MTEMISYIKKFILEFSPKLQTLVTLVDNDLVTNIKLIIGDYYRV